jgi:hypothetical protein
VIASPGLNQASEFTGTARYQLIRRLGAGAFGVVYEAKDTVLGGNVALKLLHAPSGKALYRFKKEFRSLADLKHENLVGLRELTSEGERWFFTMEFVRGVDVVAFICGDAARRVRPPSASVSGSHSRPREDLGLLVEAALVDGEITGGAPEVAPVALDIGRLRETFSQLARGVCALHDAEKIHRDIKPSNMLVEPGGRVVLLDFGLVTETSDGHITADDVVGTPAYMAPEQALADNVGPACDWYSVGCVLYLTLTGRLPILGTHAIELLGRKQVEVPPLPSELRAGIPADLEELCMALLERDPARRPSGNEVLRRLGAPSRHTSVGLRPSAPGGGFVGRARELATLADAYRTMRDGRAVVATVRGRSGIGKSALVRGFIEQAERADPGVVALTGRCYERESVPYKALDAIVDGLSRYMRRIPESERGAITPRHVGALARLFPVFNGVAATQPRLDNLRDTLEIRRRGFSALRELLARLADRQRVILFIDDVQWGDIDSAAALAEILAPPDPAPLLLVLGFRTEGAEANTLLGMLDDVGRGNHLERFDIELGPLADDEARELVARLAQDAGGPAVAARMDQLVREGAGMPFMLGELVTFMHQVGDASGRARALESSEPTVLVDALVRERAALLDDDARALLEIVCVAGQPLSRVSACRAARIERPQASVDALRIAKLVRSRGNGEAEKRSRPACCRPPSPLVTTRSRRRSRGSQPATRSASACTSAPLAARIARVRISNAPQITRRRRSRSSAPLGSIV